MTRPSFAMQRMNLSIRGRVQGVCYRAFAAGAARRLGVVGFVRNLPDGSVELLAEGASDALADLLDACRRGPPYARVTEVTEAWSAATGQYRSFEIVT